MKKFSWSIRIEKLVSWIGVGVCFKNKIKDLNFQFSYQALGHGSFMVSSNGYAWSSSSTIDNGVMKGWSFVMGDIITIEFDPIDWTLAYTVQSAEKVAPSKSKMMTKPQYKKLGTTKKFKLALQPNLMDEYYPCVNLCSMGDSVEIV